MVLTGSRTPAQDPLETLSIIKGQNDSQEDVDHLEYMAMLGKPVQVPASKASQLQLQADPQLSQ